MNGKKSSKNHFELRLVVVFYGFILYFSIVADFIARERFIICNFDLLNLGNPLIFKLYGSK